MASLKAASLVILALLLTACSGGAQQADKERPAPDSSQKIKFQNRVVEEPQKIQHSIFNGELLNFSTDALKTEGMLDPAVFKRVMGKRKSSFKVCYKKALDIDKQARGEVKLSFNITPTGRVSNVMVKENNFPHQETVDCLVRVVRRIRFPEPPQHNRVSVEYPFVFSP